MKIQISFSKVTRKELTEIERDSTIRCGVEYEFKLDELSDGLPLSSNYENIQSVIEDYKADLRLYGKEIVQVREDWFEEYQEAVQDALASLKKWKNSGPEYDNDLDLSKEEKEDFKGQIDDAYKNIKRYYSKFADVDECIRQINGTTYEDFTGIQGYSLISTLPLEVEDAHDKIEELEELEYPNFPESPTKLDDFFDATVFMYVRRLLKDEYKINEHTSSVLEAAPVEQFNRYIEGRREEDIEDQLNNEESKDKILLKVLENKDWSSFPVGNDPLIGAYHSFSPDTLKWRIETDRSLEYQGVEIISPPLNLDETFETMKQMFDAIKEEGYTDRECGLHINLSTPDMSNMNLAKLLLFIDEGYVDKFFKGRRESRFVQFVDSKIAQTKNAVENLGIKRYKKIEDEMIRNYDSGKYGAINIKGFNAASKSGSNRIEFRYLGSTDYENKFNYIKTQILKYAYYMKIACDPSYKRTEYLKKLMRIRVKHGGLNFDPKVAEKIKETSTFIAYRVGKKIVRVPKDGSTSV